MASLNISSLPNLSKASFAEISSISFGEYFDIIKPLIFYIIGITIYSIFIFKFYKFISKRDLLKLDLHKRSESFEGPLAVIVKVIFYIIENLILIPLFLFFWFIVLAIILLILSKSSSPHQILILAVSLVAAVRVSSYYNENLSQDLAKMIPFALLGIFLIDASFFSVAESLSIAKQIPTLWKISIYYLVFVIILEFILRIVHGIVTLIRGPNSIEEEFSHSQL